MHAFTHLLPLQTQPYRPAQPSLATMPQLVHYYPSGNGWTTNPPKKNTTSKNPSSTKPVIISVKDSERGHKFEYSGPANSSITTQALQISKKMLAKK